MEGREMLNKYSIFSKEIQERMIGVEGKIGIDADGAVNIIPVNITEPTILYSVPFDCRECESTDDLSVDYIDSLFDLLLEQTQN
jgi:hypothetical protein